MPPAPRRGLAGLPRHPLAWLLLALGVGLIAAAGALAGRQQLAIGSPAEPLYLRDGFDGLEHGPAGPFRWTHPVAQIVLPHAGPGPLTVALTLFDGAPAARALALAVDGRTVYQGQTQPGGAPWVLAVPATAATDTPRVTITTARWSPPRDRRVLGVALTAVNVEAPAARARGWIDAGALVIAVCLLVAAATWRTGATSAPLVAGIAVLAFAGSLLAYGDVWLNRIAPAAAGLALLAAGALVRFPQSRGAARRAAVWGAVALAAFLALLTLARFDTGDAEGMYQVTAGLAEDGVPWQHLDHMPIKFGLGQPLAWLPPYWLGHGWAALAGIDPGPLTRFCVAWFNSGVVAATVLLLFWGARRRYGAPVALALAGTFLLATPAVPYARLAFAEPLSTLLILAAFLLLWQSKIQNSPLRSAQGRLLSEAKGPKSKILVVGLALGLAILVKPANAIYVPVPALYLAWTLAGGADRRPGWRRVLAGGLPFALGLLPGLALAGAYNAWRYGSALNFGYQGEGFTTPLLTGLYGLLASPGKGLIWFAPPVLLTPFALAVAWRSGDRQRRAEALCIAAQAILGIGFYAIWWSWSGNIAWGPRLILPLVPLLLWPLGALAPGRRAQRAWWLLGVAGFLVTIPGTLIDQYYYFAVEQVSKPGTAAEAHMLFDPAWSQIVAHWRFLLTGTRAAVMRPTLAALGLPSVWDTLVPAALLVVALVALLLALAAVAPALPSVHNARSSPQRRRDAENER